MVYDAREWRQRRRQDRTAFDAELTALESVGGSGYEGLRWRSSRMRGLHCVGRGSEGQDCRVSGMAATGCEG